MKQLILITGILMMTGMTNAQARSCRSSEVERGCHTEHGNPKPGSPHGAPYCDCSDANEDPLEQLEAFDVILNFDGQKQKVRCCGGHHTARECPCDF